MSTIFHIVNRRTDLSAVAERAKILPERVNIGLAEKGRPSDKKGDAMAFWGLRAGGKRPANGATKEAIRSRRRSVRPRWRAFC